MGVQASKPQPKSHHNHNLMSTQFAIVVTAWQMKVQNLPYAMHF